MQKRRSLLDHYFKDLLLWARAIARQPAGAIALLVSTDISQLSIDVSQL
jgi:hypothetical protein